MRSGAAPHDTESTPHSDAKDSRAFEQPRFQLGVPSGHYYLADVSALGNVKKIIDIVATIKLEYKLCPPPP